MLLHSEYIRFNCHLSRDCWIVGWRLFTNQISNSGQLANWYLIYTIVKNIDWLSKFVNQHLHQSGYYLWVRIWPEHSDFPGLPPPPFVPHPFTPTDNTIQYNRNTIPTFIRAYCGCHKLWAHSPVSTPHRRIYCCNYNNVLPPSSSPCGIVMNLIFINKAMACTYGLRCYAVTLCYAKA